MFRLFICEYAVIMFFNTVQSIITILSPFMIKYMIDFIKTGENPFAKTFNFWDTSDIEWLSWLTREY